MTSTEPRTWHAAVVHQVRAPDHLVRSALIAGDESQFERFFERCYAGIKRIAGCAPDPSEAETLVQQAVADFCSELESAETGLSLEAELFGCVLRRVRARALELGQ